LDTSFNSEEWNTLTPAERVARCNTLSREAISLAKDAPDTLRDSYLTIASEWLKFATEIERLNK